MRVSDSVLRAHLRNVYWVAGAACGGKTTIASQLAHRHGFIAYHPEERNEEHRKLANPNDHPNMLLSFQGWEWFFGRPVDEYASTIINADQERFEMVIVDAIKLSRDHIVVVDAHALDCPDSEWC